MKLSVWFPEDPEHDELLLLDGEKLKKISLKTQNCCQTIEIFGFNKFFKPLFFPSAL